MDAIKFRSRSQRVEEERLPVQVAAPEESDISERDEGRNRNRGGKKRRRGGLDGKVETMQARLDASTREMPTARPAERPVAKLQVLSRNEARDIIAAQDNPQNWIQDNTSRFASAGTGGSAATLAQKTVGLVSGETFRKTKESIARAETDAVEREARRAAKKERAELQRQRARVTCRDDEDEQNGADPGPGWRTKPTPAVLAVPAAGDTVGPATIANANPPSQLVSAPVANQDAASKLRAATSHQGRHASTVCS